MDWLPKLPRGADALLSMTFASCGFVLLALAVVDAAHGAVRNALLHGFWGLTLASLALMPGILRRELRQVLRDRHAIPRPASVLQLAGLLCLGLWVALTLAGWPAGQGL